eukprot:m.343831 g.343831  ORF g.343831 m.343831 type:complete len:981 (+) comp23431_c0_seq1:74-3016(+)
MCIAKMTDGYKLQAVALFLLLLGCRVDTKKLTPLPPDPPIVPHNSVLHSDMLHFGQVLQLWGHSQFVALTNPNVAPALKKYGFNVVIMVPYKAHNAMCQAEAHGQQCTSSDVLSLTQFQTGIDTFAKVNISLMLYTSIMHCGHSSVWENGTLQREHPSWSERDELGQCPQDYGSCNLSPASDGAVQYTVNYTMSLQHDFPSVKAFMIDNAVWQTVPSSNGSLPSGFEPPAVSSFREYIQQRFGDTAPQYFGMNVSSISPPTISNRSATNPSPLFGVWKVWRERVYAAAAEEFRSALHAQDVALIANTVFFPLSWSEGCARELQHLDGALSESHFDSPTTMSLKQNLAHTLMLGRPSINYIALFNQSCQSHYEGTKCHLREKSIVRGMITSSFLQMARPWLVAWGLSQQIDAPTDHEQYIAQNETLLLMQWRNTKFDNYFYFGGYRGDLKAVRVGVLCSYGHNNEDEVIRAPALILRNLGVPFRFETEVTIVQYNSLNNTIPLQLLLCEGMATMGLEAANTIVEWVRDGGVLWATDTCAIVDEAGRHYGGSLLQTLLNNSFGKGHASFITGALEDNKECIEQMMQYDIVVSPKEPTHATPWEISPWFDSDQSRLVVHVSNATDTQGISPIITQELLLLLLVPEVINLRSVYLIVHLDSPYVPELTAKWNLTKNRSLEIMVETPPPYFVIQVDFETHNKLPGNNEVTKISNMNHKQVLFWFKPDEYTYYDNMKALEQHRNAVTDIVLYCGYGASPEGVLVSNITHGRGNLTFCIKAIPTLKSLNFRVFLILKTQNRSLATVLNVLQNKDAFIDSMVEICSELGVNGFNVDFEPVDKATDQNRLDLQTFLYESNMALQQRCNNATVSIDIASSCLNCLNNNASLYSQHSVVWDMSTYYGFNSTTWTNNLKKYMNGVNDIKQYGVGFLDDTTTGWDKTEESVKYRVNTINQLGITKIAVFYLNVSNNLPASFYWQYLENFLQNN